MHFIFLKTTVLSLLELITVYNLYEDEIRSWKKAITLYYQN